MQSGLVSISFRARTPEEIISAVRDAGLRYIEWGSDVHVPEGDLVRAGEVRALTEAAGLAVSSYGSYYKLGQGQSIEPYIASAEALGAPIIRIWAGTKGSAGTTAAERRELVSEAKSVCRTAAAHNLKIDFEYHPNTLTDDASSALHLLEEVAAPNCGIYWQPNYKLSREENLSALATVLPHTDILHLFYWNPDGSRRHLCEGRAELAAFLAAASRRPTLKLLEFVPGDDIGILAAEAETLHEILKESEASL